MTRNGFAATRCHVEVAESTTHRTWHDVRDLLAAAALPDAVRGRAHAIFERLAVAEGAVHGTSPDDVHFHEVGALDAIADVVGVCAGLAHLGLERPGRLAGRRRLGPGAGRPRRDAGAPSGGRRAAARRAVVRRTG